MKLLKKRPKSKPGWTVTIHLDPHAVEPVVWPATYTPDGREIKPERVKWCHKVLGYSTHKTPPQKPWEHKSEFELLRELEREVKRGKKQAK